MGLPDSRGFLWGSESRTMVKGEDLALSLGKGQAAESLCFVATAKVL